MVFDIVYIKLVLKELERYFDIFLHRNIPVNLILEYHPEQPPQLLVR
nr:MAG TPA_asm: hypothetical protein [Caudoviricetes sp.]